MYNYLLKLTWIRYKVYLLIPGSHPFSSASSVEGIEIICMGYIQAAGNLLGCGIMT